MSSRTATAVTMTDALRDDLRLMAYASSGGSQAAPAAVARNSRLVREAALRWLPQAHLERQAAASSPAERSQWTALIAAANPDQRVNSFESLMVMARSMRELLLALTETLTPHPRVYELSQRLTEAISRGDYPPGHLLTLRSIADEYQVPVPRVRMASNDLITAGLAERRLGHALAIARRHAYPPNPPAPDPLPGRGTP